jgi:hypothetical protein
MKQRALLTVVIVLLTAVSRPLNAIGSATAADGAASTARTSPRPPGMTFSSPAEVSRSAENAVAVQVAAVY